MSTYSALKGAAATCGLVLRTHPDLVTCAWLERVDNRTGGYWDRLLQHIGWREPKQIGMCGPNSVNWFDEKYKDVVLRFSDERKRRGDFIVVESIAPYFTAGPTIFGMK